MGSEKTLTYRNAMESLTADEVERQFQQIQPRLARYLSKEEVAAFALNRLPALYATSEKGWRQQCVRGRRDFGTQVTAAVRQGLVAVQRDPLRVESPLSPPENEEVQLALRKLKTLLKREDLSWNNVVDTVEQALIKTARGEITWHQKQAPAAKGAGWNNEYRY